MAGGKCTSAHRTRQLRGVRAVDVTLLGVKRPGTADSTVAKKVNANIWDFDIKMAGKAIGHVHRVVSADGKVLTVHNTGRQGNIVAADDTMVFDKQ